MTEQHHRHEVLEPSGILGVPLAALAVWLWFLLTRRTLFYSCRPQFYLLCFGFKFIHLFNGHRTDSDITFFFCVILTCAVTV